LSVDGRPEHLKGGEGYLEAGKDVHDREDDHEVDYAEEGFLVVNRL